MKKTRFAKKCLALVLCAAMLFAQSAVCAFAATTAEKTTADGLKYTVNSNSVTITQYVGTAEEVTVPKTIGGSPVTTIGDGAFSYRSALRKVTLPDSITSICMMAFFGCSALEEINIDALPALSHIGAYAFIGAAISGDLRLPESVTNIGASAFSCTNLRSLHLGKNVGAPKVDTGKPWSRAFGNVDMGSASQMLASLLANTNYSPNAEFEKSIALSCPNLVRITVSPENKNYTSVGGVLFSKDMTKLYCYPSGKTSKIYMMPSTVTDFYNAFGGLHLNSLSNVPFVGDLDVMDNIKVPVGDDNKNWIDVGETGKWDTVILSPRVKNICSTAFYNSSVKSIFIPKSVTSIGEKAFWHCRNLVTVGFDRDSVYTQLPKQCFKDCENLKNITFGKVQYLSEAVFDACTALESVDLTNVQSLDSSAFDNCTSLSTVVYGDTDSADKATVSASAFQETASLETVMLGNSVQTVEAQAFADCKSLKTAYISDEVESIDSTAFSGCDNLTIAVPTETCYAYNYAVKNKIPVTTLQISPIANQTYTGSAIEPEFTVTASGRQLTENVDYETHFKNNTDTGTANVTVVGLGEYSIFAAVAKFAILQRDMEDDVLVGNILPQTLAGTAAEPAPVLSCGSYVLVKDVDYTVSYANNTEAGQATVTVTGIGNFTGTKTLTFEIVDTPKDTEIAVTPGDIDGNGEVTMSDYAMVLSAALGATQITDPASYRAADINGDGVVDAFDAAEIDLLLYGYKRQSA